VDVDAEALLGDAGSALERGEWAAARASFERGRVAFPPFETAADDVDYHSTRLGPLIAVRALTEADGRWPSLRETLERLHEGLESAEYLLAVGHKR
jgi:hypothetical protein